MTTMVEIKLTSLHEGCIAEVQYTNPVTGAKMGMAAKMGAVGDVCHVACHTGANLIIEEVRVG